MATEDPLFKEKAVAFYAAMVEAWVATRMEKDRTLLTLAAGGIGLLVTLLTTVAPTSGWQLGFYAAGGLSFLATVILAIKIFDRNSEHVERVIYGEGRRESPFLDKLDKWLFRSFVSGVLCTCIVAGWSGYVGLQRRNSVANQQAEIKAIVTTPGETKSLSGVGNLAPTPLRESLSGVANLAPTPAPVNATPAAAQGTGTPANASPSTPKE
jgi:hypothetical protein